MGSTAALPSPRGLVNCNVTLGVGAAVARSGASNCAHPRRSTAASMLSAPAARHGPPPVWRKRGGLGTGAPCGTTAALAPPISAACPGRHRTASHSTKQTGASSVGPSGTWWSASHVMTAPRARSAPAVSKYAAPRDAPGTPGAGSVAHPGGAAQALGAAAPAAAGGPAATRGRSHPATAASAGGTRPATWLRTRPSARRVLEALRNGDMGGRSLTPKLSCGAGQVR